MTDELKRSNLELDYLKVSGKLYKFDAQNTKHRNIVKNYLENTGFEQTKSGADWVYFENKDLGMRAFFSNYPMNNRSIGKKPSLNLEFSGHYFIRDNSYLSVRKIVRFFTDSFGVFFKINRVDIRQDIYNAKYPFDYFPNFQDKSKKLIWALKGRPSFNQYNNDFSSQATGFTIKTSRYMMMSYNRNIALEDRYRNGGITKSYYDYYKKIYGNRDVQRLEISLKQDACNFFALLFFQGEHNKDDILKMTMANFGRNHALKEIEAKPLCKMEVNNAFSELFYLEMKGKVKLFKTELESKAGLKMSDVTFSHEGRSINEIVKMLAKKIGELSEGIESNLESLVEDSISMLKIKVLDFKDVFINRYGRCESAFDFMHFDMSAMMEQSEKIVNPLYIEAA